MSKPLILVTNDDGIFAPGIKALVEVAREFGDLLIVAPNSPQSAKGHAVTLHQPLRINKIDSFEPLTAYETSGTPVDCVKLAKNIILKGKKPDLCVSGINHGSNASLNIIYSGTVSAAMEASVEGIPSIGFSLCNYELDADMSAAKKIVRYLIKYRLDHSDETSLLWNVNIPYLKYEELRGIKICRQAEGRWVEEFMEGVDPRGRKYYWLAGNFVNDESNKDTDIHALEKGYVSLVPSGHDLTNYRALEILKTDDHALS